jgi:hypothetical protein
MVKAFEGLFKKDQKPVFTSLGLFSSTSSFIFSHCLHRRRNFQILCPNMFLAVCVNSNLTLFILLLEALFYLHLGLSITEGFQLENSIQIEILHCRGMKLEMTVTKLVTLIYINIFLFTINLCLGLFEIGNN